jgi:hypothetical protein
MKIERKDAYNLDAKETVFFKRQLEYIKTQTYDTKYKDLKATTLIPVSTEAPAGAKTITFRSYSQTGVAKIISDYANDFPRVDVFGIEKEAKVKSVGDSYGYSIEEIRAAQMANTNLEQRRANAARRASDEKVDDIAWNGDTEYGLLGLINYPGITEYSVPNDGTGSTKTWSTKTPDQINRDVSGIIAGVVDSTNGKEQPDTLILPITQFLLINDTRMTDGNDKTILRFILDNNVFLKKIEWVVEMKGAGVGGVDRMMVYPMDPRNLTLEIPQPFEQFDSQQKGMEFEIPCHQKTAGVIVYYPQSVSYGDGI